MSDAARLDHAFREGLTLPHGPVLAYRPVGSPEWNPYADGFRAIQTFRPDHDALAAIGMSMVNQPDGEKAALVCLTRSREESLGLIARAWSGLPKDGLLLVSGDKKAGADAVLKAVRKVVEVEGSISKAHGRLFWMRKTADTPAQLTSWSEAAAPSRNDVGFWTAPGMFSPDKVDAGSALLADVLKDELKGDVADLGAGWGWLTHAALATNSRIDTITLFEAERLALDLARRNVDDARARFEWTDVATLSARRLFDAVISNPPFHKGRAAEPELGQSFIAAASRSLKTSGTFWMVANRQLPYEQTLETHFQRWEELPGNGAFKLFRARRPRG